MSDEEYEALTRKMHETAQAIFATKPKKFRMFRGLSEDVWTERFKLRGYPPEAAREMAGFLVGRVTSPRRLYI